MTKLKEIKGWKIFEKKNFYCPAKDILVKFTNQSLKRIDIGSLKKYLKDMEKDELNCVTISVKSKGKYGYDTKYISKKRQCRPFIKEEYLKDILYIDWI